MKGKKTVIFFLLAICICLFPARNAEAAVKYKNCFVKAQNGNLSYYNTKGKKAKGIVTVKGKKYYFDGDSYWRICLFIPRSKSYEEVTPELSYEAGKAFGDFQTMLSVRWARPSRISIIWSSACDNSMRL